MKTLLPWDELPEKLKNGSVKPYYDSLARKKFQLILKFSFDRIVSFLMLVLLLPVFVALAVAIKLDSRGEVFFRQERVTRYGRRFKIYKFRTMVTGAESIGSQVTGHNDSRITRVGRKLRGCRLDELPQLINILKGEMSFVGTRPEVPRYVAEYTPVMNATLLLPAGVTGEASICFKDENRLLKDAEDIDRAYICKVLPEKMKYNLKEIEEYSFINDLKTMVKTVMAVIG